ncbi:hypothetical protein BV22DRAFT_782503 [Leucogyrophana mollusca]|uniref:Uncharacterized protein n=1 Tax=Leucogyrophana mollusca TaxID=85980 RepID=A0ACB8B649_9AGAM|nr:hypothetical protein BV22DRAFT_782503 [Leucogyrophana mollusca]
MTSIHTAAHDASITILSDLLEQNNIRLGTKRCILPATSTLYVQTLSTSQKRIYRLDAERKERCELKRKLGRYQCPAPLQ